MPLLPQGAISTWYLKSTFIEYNVTQGSQVSIWYVNLFVNLNVTMEFFFRFTGLQYWHQFCMSIFYSAKAQL